MNHVESGYRQRMLLFAYNQQRSLALKTYEQCQLVLDETFGIVPAAETTALYERIRAEEPDGDAFTPLHNLPRESASFIGREEILSQIRSKICAPLYPLVTIMGEGGVGKSRAALTVAYQLRYDFPDGVWFVPLAGVLPGNTAADTETSIALAVSHALDMQIQGNRPVLQQVLAYLEKRQALLLLDNMEHLVNGDDFVLHLLQQAKQVQIVITSRRRLNLQAEFIVRLQGLSVPQTMGETAVSDPITYANSYTSVQLFAARAARIVPDFQLTAENIEAVSRICQDVGGLPLGIELAAAQVDMFSCADIADQLTANIDHLTVTSRDLTKRHRSITAVFEYSWGLLSLREQEILAQCTLFISGFTATAAQAVADATSADLRRLLNNSLLIQPAPGRFDMHPLIKQFGRQKLQSGQYGDASAVRKHYYTYYLEWLHSHQTDLYQRPLPKLQTNSSDILQAWQWAVQAQEVALLVAAARGFSDGLFQINLCYEGIDILTDTLAALKAIKISAPNDYAVLALEKASLFGQLALISQSSVIVDEMLELVTSPEVITQVNYMKGYNLGWLGQPEQAVTYFLRTDADAPPDWIHRPFLYLFLGINFLRIGDCSQAEHYYEKALNERKKYGEDAAPAILTSAGRFFYYSRQIAKAIQHHEAALAIPQFQAATVCAKASTDLGLAYASLYQFDKADALFKTALKLSRNIKDKDQEGYALWRQAQTYTWRGELDRAVAKAREAIRHYQPMNYNRGVSGAQKALGNALYEIEDWAGAERAYQAAFDVWEGGSVMLRLIEPLAGLAATAYAQGDLEKARELVDRLLALGSGKISRHSSMEDPLRVNLVCYEVLTAVADNNDDDLRATQFLQTAYDLLQKQAKAIEDTAVRQRFLQNISTHREIMRLS